MTRKFISQSAQPPFLPSYVTRSDCLPTTLAVCLGVSGMRIRSSKLSGTSPLSRCYDGKRDR